MGDNRLLKVVLGHEFQIQSPKYESHPIVVATSIAPFTFNGIPWEKWRGFALPLIHHFRR